ncbi:hypothetical protein LPJ67_004318, partial [Coemansia sp. RSA 1938]
MPVYSVAQTLPMHVIEDIMQYASLEHIAALPLKELPLRPKKQAKLLPLMSVCQSWRAVAGSMFYHTALLKLKEVEPYEFSSERHLTLGHVIEIGAQLLVKELYVHVYVPNFCVNWDSMDTSDESTAQTLATMVSDCGDLPTVRSLKLILTSDDGNYRQRFNTVDKPEHDKDIILKNIQTFGEHLKQHAPNAWKVDVFSNYFHSRMNLNHQEDFVVDNVSQLVSANVGHISLKHVKIAKPMVVKLSENTLRSLTIAYHKGTQKHIDIVRNNSSTLETLCVDHITTHSMLKMTWGKTGGYHTLVYPRLKHLIINSCVGQRNLSYRQPLVNPFPKLQTLICRGYFPFSSPIVLMEGRAHIRHLDITLDTALLQMYADSKVFEKGSFETLQFQFNKLFQNAQLKVRKGGRAGEERGAQGQGVAASAVGYGFGDGRLSDSSVLDNADGLDGCGLDGYGLRILGVVTAVGSSVGLAVLVGGRLVGGDESGGSDHSDGEGLH